jgi:photoactive yellow protein
MDTMTDTAWAQSSRLAGAGISFVPTELLLRLDEMDAAELDAMPFAAVRVADDGEILATNVAHDQFVGLPSTQQLGRNWFFDIAPCTNNRLFRGLFRRGVTEGRMSLFFFYAFTFRMAPTDTRVHLHRTAGGANWIFLRRA